MKRVILWMLCLLLSTAFAEECTHENLLMCSLRSQCVDLGDGHQMVHTKSCVCDDCSTNVVSRMYGDLRGHVFHLSESIHFEADGMHLWVFICPECWHVTLREETCTGGDQCQRFAAQAGEHPTVQNDLPLQDARLLTHDDYIKRWIVQDRPDKNK